ncbi:MAG: PDZ domain-containing protein, partial [Gammaproteobacteria bacterium]
MNRIFLLTAALMLLAPPLAMAADGQSQPADKTQSQQANDQLDQAKLQRENDQQDQAKLRREKEQQDQAQQGKDRDQNRAQLEQQLEQAQEKLQALAQRVAQLSMQLNGPDMQRAMRLRFFRPNHAILGVTIGDPGDTSHSDKGVKISAVTPGGPAEKAGLHAGDVITGINDTNFASKADESATDRLLEFMDKVKPDDTLKVAYLRGGKAATASIKAGRIDRDNYAFAFPTPPPAPPMPPMPPEPNAPMVQPVPDVSFSPHSFFWVMNGGGVTGDMQLIPLSKGLGQYFGTDKGLLVVHAAQKSALKLEDGDVILKIGGRDPG